MSRKQFQKALPFVVALMLVVTPILSASSPAAPSSATGALTNKVILFASDGMRPDLMQKYARRGLMPTYARLMRSGVVGLNGLQQAFPPNTGVGWYTLATGTWPSEHGSTNNTYFRLGDTFSNRTSFSAAGTMQADTIANAAERAGKKVAQINWVGGAQANINGPTVDFVNFYSTRGVIATPLVPDEAAGAAAFGIAYTVPTVTAAAGWTNVPASNMAPMQTTLVVTTTFSSQNPTRTYDVYLFGSTVDPAPGYDHVLLVRSALAKNAALAAVDLAVGDFKEIKLKKVGADNDGLINARDGQTAGFYVKLISLASNLSSFKLYFTSVERVIASCKETGAGAVAACDDLYTPGTPLANSESKLEKYIAENMPTYISADFAPLEGRIIDEETYVEQGRDLEKEFSDQVLAFILGTLQPNTQLALVGYPVTDEFSHQFMALYTPTDMDGNPNPYYDDVNGDSITDGRVAIREGYVASAYHEADALLGLTRRFMGLGATVFASSDHGFAPQWRALNARKILFDTQVFTPTALSVHASGGNTASNCGATTSDFAKACWAGGTVQIYVNPTLPSGVTNAMVRTAVTNAFNALGPNKISAIFQKEQLRNVDGTDALHPNRSGDVVVVSRPPYQWDAATPGVVDAFSQFFGQHGYLPDLVDLAHNVNMRATFLASGPGIRQRGPVAGVRAIDVAPTAAFVLGIPGTQNDRGRILYEMLGRINQFKEITLLNISDYHGQLPPLTETADTVGVAYSIGGSAFLKPWLDWYRNEANLTGGSMTFTSGDQIGATPPISAAFGDLPSIESLKDMGMDWLGLGNHDFDAGQAYLRGTIIPYAAPLPFFSSNIVYTATGLTPAEWSPYGIFTFPNGVKLGVVGWSNEDLPTLIFPGNLGPFQVEPALAHIIAAAADARSHKGVKIVIAPGHDGATAGTITSPTGPLVDLADNLGGVVDAIIGDHSNFQVDATRPNGVLVTENLSKGVRFTRIRIVVDARTGQPLYKTADWHKPWNIGVTPDAAMQAKIDAYNALLGPIFNTVIGYSTVAIPRSDRCGRSDGRLCESRNGDLITDAMLKTYSAAIGTQFSITNSGGIRADMTCPVADNGADFCPASLYPFATVSPGLFPITRGQNLTVLPFGNIVVTMVVNGAELKTMLENGVSSMPAANGRYPQVSGLCFNYNISAAANSRVTAAFYANPDGSCSATPIDLTAASTYKIAENDFMASGGDGYPNFFARQTTQAIMDQVVADYITLNSPVSPSYQDRIKCFAGAVFNGSPCPAFVP